MKTASRNKAAAPPAGAFAAVSDGAAEPLPCEWASAKDGVGSREIALNACGALAEAGDVARLTLTFESDEGGAAIEETAEIRAYELTVEAEAEWPSNRTRHVFGPLERAKLTIVPKATSVEWTFGSIRTNSQSCVLPIPFRPGKSRGSVVVDGTAFEYEFETIEPTHFRALSYGAATEMEWGGNAPTNGQVGVGLTFHALQLLPDWVSFRGIQVKEGYCPPSGMTGLFNFEGAESVLFSHGEQEGAGIILSVRDENFAGGDFASTSLENVEQPWEQGSFRYEIPQYWRIFGMDWRLFGTESQIFTFSPNGDMTVEKFGVALTRGTNGISRITKETTR